MNIQDARRRRRRRQSGKTLFLWRNKHLVYLLFSINKLSYFAFTGKENKFHAQHIAIDVNAQFVYLFILNSNELQQQQQQKNPHVC
jgi:hypothetical protein